jgi:DNA repair photolyase
MRVIETEAKSIMVASKLPDADFVLNPYTGCAFGCSYCYASFMGKYAGEPVEAWGEYVYVKINAVELARQEVESKLSAKGDATLLLSSVTDPYQGVESKYRITRGILEVLADARWPGTVGILTKSPLVTRDIDVISRLPRPSVGMTVTTTDDEISRWLEVRAPKATARLRALRQLSDAGLPTYAFVGPLLPHFRWQPELLDSLFREIAEAGVRDIYVEHINLKAYIRSRLEPRLANEPPDVQQSYVAARRDDHRAALTIMVESLRTKYGLGLRLDEVLYHEAGVARAAVKAAPPEVRSDAPLKDKGPLEQTA